MADEGRATNVRFCSNTFFYHHRILQRQNPKASRMSDLPDEKPETPFIQQSDTERLNNLVSTRFQIEESLMENNVPTYYLKQPQETKQAFLKLLKDLKPLNLIALLRWRGNRIVLKIVQKPPVKPSNVWVNWLLFLATIGTTFVTGYLLSGDMINPFLGGASFTVAIMAVLGMHEMGHKLTADKNDIDATPPYFIPGPPPIPQFGILGTGTFGAVIMQKSLPSNKDSLFDVGSSGPVIGFILAFVVSVIGLLFSPIYPITDPNMGFLPSPLIFDLFAAYMLKLPSNYYIVLHPVAFAGWVGMIVTMLNLLPAAMLDGGHVSRALFGEKTRLVLTGLSILMLFVAGFIPMGLLVLFMAMYRHPGPLDDVSSLSRGRKLMAIGLLAIFVLTSFLHYFVLLLLSYII
jgi:membrane-associated protease RseP (regulator of RpoE activity)